MVLLTLPLLLVIVLILGLGLSRPRATGRPQQDERPPDAAPTTTAHIHVVLVAASDDGVLLDCVLAEQFGLVPRGQPFTMVLRVASPAAAAVRDVFEAWAEVGVPVRLQIEVDLHGPRARFSAGGTEAVLAIVASSPLAGRG